MTHILQQTRIYFILIYDYFIIEILKFLTCSMNVLLAYIFFYEILLLATSFHES